MTPLTRAGPCSHAALLAATQRQAAQIPAFYTSHRRFLRFVDTHQKWLLVHLLADVSTAQQAVDAGEGIAVSWICDRAAAAGIASRNTTLSFFHQLHAYGYLSRTACRSDRRIMRVALTPEAQGIFADWAILLFETTDFSQQRPAISRAQGWQLYKRVAHVLLATPKWVHPPLDIRMIQDVRGGWLVMFNIVSLIEAGNSGHDGTGNERLPVREFSVAGTARSFALSRSTLYRLLGRAADAGTMNFAERDGNLSLFVNGYHLQQYCRWNGRLMEAVRVAVAGMPASAFQECEHITVSSNPSVQAAYAQLPCGL